MIEDIQMQAWLQSIVCNQEGYPGLHCLINDNIDLKEERVPKSQQFPSVVEAAPVQTVKPKCPLKEFNL